MRDVLSLGAVGPAVGALQQALVEAGEEIAAADLQVQHYGASTTAAVASYQRAHGLHPDGVCGPRTQAALAGAADTRFTAAGWRLDTTRAAVAEVLRQAVALCSDAMSEGLNLQGAAVVVHLDTPTVIRTAEQRAGRVDRMDSRHDEVEIWWPRDPASFAPRRRDLLRERHELVTDLIGANLQLPEEAAGDARLAIEDLARQTSAERDDPTDFYDAFRPIRDLIGEGGLVSEQLYSDMRTSQADVVSGVSLVSAPQPFAFLAVSGLARSAPRWVFLDALDGDPITDLAVVSDRLRLHLRDDPPNVSPTEPRAASLVDLFVKRLEVVERQLLPVRRQRALALAEKTLIAWRDRAWRDRDEPRQQLMRTLLAVLNPDPSAPHADLASVAEAWIRLVRPYQQEALRHRRSRRKPWTLNDLEAPLRDRPIPTALLQRAFEELPMVPSVGERVVAMIVGVPE